MSFPINHLSLKEQWYFRFISGYSTCIQQTLVKQLLCQKYKTITTGVFVYNAIKQSHIVLIEKSV